MGIEVERCYALAEHYIGLLEVAGHVVLPVKENWMLF